VVGFVIGYVVLVLYYLYSLTAHLAGRLYSDDVGIVLCAARVLSKHPYGLLFPNRKTWSARIPPSVSFQTLALRELARNGQLDPSAGSRPHNPLAHPADQNTFPARPICRFLSVREMYPCCLSVFMIH
jgi:hypothetical protein